MATQNRYPLLLLPLIYSISVNGADTGDSEKIYKTYCGGCHGANLEGASATPLIKDNWQYGRDSFSIGQNIRHGIAKAGMPPWSNVLSDAQIDKLVGYIITAQTSPPVAKPIPDTLTTQHYTLNTERFTTLGLTSPWGIEFTGENTALITDNAGQLFRFENSQLDPTPITGLPTVDTATSTGGLLDIALDPDYANNSWVYLAYSFSENPTERSGPGMTRIIRGKVTDNRWHSQQSLFEMEKGFHLGNSKHWGGRLLFDKAGKLYFSIGDMSQPMDSQNLAMPSGKVFRINPDGSIPEDNPFADKKDALKAIYTLGNRNVQGLAQHPVTGEIWATEHGPQGGDELNILKSGYNYGWPLVTFGVNYDGSEISPHTHKEGLEAPVAEWTPALAVCPIEFSTSPLFPKWKNNLLLGSLSLEELRRLKIENGKVVKQETLVKGYGRIRDVKVGPDGAIYLLLNNPGELVRLTPES